MSDLDHELITLIDEDGQESEFLLVNSLELDGKKYAAIVPMEAVWMRIDLDEDGNEVFAPLTDDESDQVDQAWGEIVAGWDEEPEPETDDHPDHGDGIEDCASDPMPNQAEMMGKGGGQRDE